MYQRRTFSKQADVISRKLAEAPTIEVLKALGYTVVESSRKKHIMDVIRDNVPTKILWEARGIDNGYEYQAFKQNGSSHWNKIRTSAERYTNFLLEGCTEIWCWVRTPGRCENVPLLAMWPMRTEDVRVVQAKIGDIYESFIELNIENASLFANLDGQVVSMTWDDEFDDNLSADSQSRFYGCINAKAA